MAGRDQDKGVELREGDGLVRTTIVGGQPRKKPSLRMTVKVGLERLLYLAATDTRFRAALLNDRERAMTDAGLVLSESEAAVLACVDGDTLATMIQHVRPEVRPDRRFMKSVAATFLTLATGTAQVGCFEAQSAGISPDDIDPYQDVPTDVLPDGADHSMYLEIPEIYPDAGILPDVPEVFMDVAEVYPDAGIVPDVPDVALEVDEIYPDAGTQPDAPDVEIDVQEVYPDGGTQPDVPDDVLPSVDAPPADVPAAEDLPPEGDPDADAPLEDPDALLEDAAQTDSEDPDALQADDTGDDTDAPANDAPTATAPSPARGGRA